MIQATECPVEIAVLTRSQSNRPQLPMTSPSHVVFHEVGNMNPGADEDMHRDFVHSGGGVNNVSFHFVCGPTKIIQLIYLNENAWHASDGYYGYGNRDSIAIEHIQIGDFDKTLDHSAWLMAELYRNPGRFATRPDYDMIDDLDPKLVKERTITHHQTAPDKKWCPTFVLNRGLWQPYLEAVNRELNKPTPVTYQPAKLPPWWSLDTIIDGQDREWNGIEFKYCHMEYTVLRSTPCWGQIGKNGFKVRANVVPGEKVIGRYRFKSKGGVNYVMTHWGTRIRADALSPFISIRSLG